MEANIVQLRGKLDSVESQINPTEIAARREFLHKNKGLLDIFNTFWVILLVYTTDGFLSKEGYSKFHHAVEIALAGEATFASVDEQALNADWTYDRMLYGNLNKIAFFDMLFELIGKYHIFCLHHYNTSTYFIHHHLLFLLYRNLDGDRGPHVLCCVCVGFVGQHCRHCDPPAETETAERDAVHHEDGQRGGE